MDISVIQKHLWQQSFHPKLWLLTVITFLWKMTQPLSPYLLWVTSWCFEGRRGTTRMKEIICLSSLEELLPDSYNSQAGSALTLSVSNDHILSLQAIASLRCKDSILNNNCTLLFIQQNKLILLEKLATQTCCKNPTFSIEARLWSYCVSLWLFCVS